MKKLVALLSLILVVSMVILSCGTVSEPEGEVVSLSSQLDALTELDKGTVDVAIIDSVMAGYYTSMGQYKDSFELIEGIEFTQEQYGIAGRKADNAFIEKINEALVALAGNGTINDIATFFGVTDSLCVNSQTTYSTGAEDNSWNEIVTSGKVIIGYTVFAPIAYIDTNNAYGTDTFTGFDVELARAVFEYLNTQYETNIEVEFLEIEWDSKEVNLNDGTIDLIWNGLTIDNYRLGAMNISIPYLNNNQVAVVKAGQASKYTTKESFATAIIGVEDGSVGEDVANELIP